MADWNRIDTVLLDMDGVLLDLHFDDHFWETYLPERYAAIHGMEVAAARELLLSWYAELEGTLDWYDVDYWSRKLGFEVAPMKVRHVHRIATHEGTVPFLNALAAAGKRRLLVTNCHPKPTRLKLAATGIARQLDGIVSAFDLGLSKEDPAFWGKLRAHTHFDPARTLLIEDSARNLASARRYGIAHLVFLRHPNTKRPERPPAGFPSFKDLAAFLAADPPSQSPCSGTVCECDGSVPSAPPH